MKAIGITLFCLAIAIIVLSVFAGMQKDSARTERLQANITPLEFATITINEPKAKVTTDSFTDHDLGITFDLDPWMLTKGTGETAFRVQIENLVPAMFYKYRDIQKITVMAFCTFRNKRGQESYDRVMTAAFTRKNAESVNWEKVRLDDLLELADVYWEHPGN